MRQLLFALALSALTAGAIRAQEAQQQDPGTGTGTGTGTETPDIDEGFDLLGEGARLILRSLITEMEPALKEMQDGLGSAVAELEPKLRDLAAMMGDLRNYHPPEKLENGDILIRRKTPEELAQPEKEPVEPAEPGGEIEL